MTYTHVLGRGAEGVRSPVYLWVPRRMMDLRRYSPVVIQNNGGQVNVGAWQVNVTK